MKYIYAGYIISLSLLFIYGVALVIRRSRLERSAGSMSTGSMKPNEKGLESSRNCEKVESS